MRFFLPTSTALFLLLASTCEARYESSASKNAVFKKKNSTFLSARPSSLEALNKPRGGAKLNPQAQAVLNAVASDRLGFEIQDFSIGSIIKGRLSSSEVVMGFMERLKNSTTIYYLISLALSAFYFYKFIKTDTVECAFYTDGFCVTNLEVENGLKKCVNPQNSHTWSFFEDVLFTIIAIVLPFTKFAGSDIDIPTKIAIPGIIASHGILHGWISSQLCSVTDKNLIAKATKLYEGFVYVLTGIMFFLFSDVPEKRGILMTIAEIVLISFGIVKLTLSKVQEGNAIAPLFMCSQLLIGYLGAFHPGELATKVVGQTFIFPCAVSLLEFLDCGWLNKYGGHAWYDFFLHISVVASLLPKDTDLLDYLPQFIAFGKKVKTDGPAVVGKINKVKGKVEKVKKAKETIEKVKKTKETIEKAKKAKEAIDAIKQK